MSLVASLQASGQLTAARDEIDRCVGRHPEGAEVWHVLGVLALEMGEHQRALDAFQRALSLAPDSVETRRSYLMALEYNPGVSDQARLAAAKEWGQWASELARRCANLLQRQKHAPSHPRKLRLGFVSADLCSHPVGLFLRPVLQALDSSRFEVFCYSHGGRDDNVRSELRKACYWRDITLLDDFAAAQRIVDQSKGVRVNKIRYNEDI